MYISTEIQSFSQWGNLKQIVKLLKDAGFDAYDFSVFYGSHGDKLIESDDYLKQAKELRAYADEIGIVCNQAHAPFPSETSEQYRHLGMEPNTYRAYARKKIKRSIEVAGVLGAKVIVVHPWNDYNAEENAKMYFEFEETARKASVKIGVENMWNWKANEEMASAAACSHHEDFKAHLDLLPSDVFVACLDIGHAEMVGLDTSSVQMIECLSNRLQALHIHDNDKLRDYHQLPFMMDVDYERIIEALKKIGYQGDVTLEAGLFLERFPTALYPQAARLMAEVADYIRKKLLKK